MRSGQYVDQPGGYRAFVPAPLPPDPPVEIDGELTDLLAEANLALGRLDGASSTLPESDLFVAMYVRQEAVLSSQIEGTQSSLEDVLQFEIDPQGRERPKDVAEVVNYIKAMDHGLAQLRETPPSLDLIREIHALLMEGARGGEASPGHFRQIQNWVGPRGATLASATFVPPPPSMLPELLTDFEHFVGDASFRPDLIHCGLVHAQFESLHPFRDGNGRVGRLLITLLLCQRGALRRPLLYLSEYLKLYRAEYYNRLNLIRTRGDWEGWLRFFLQGVYEVSEAAAATVRAILDLRERDRDALTARLGAAPNALRLLDRLFRQPLVSIAVVAEWLECTFPTASALVDQFETLGLLREMTGGRRNRRYQYDEYLRLFGAAG